ncbi:MAG: CRISPR-associated CARF protein Csa3 [Candidatus Baldrarchaeia archaeon]
MKTIIITFGFDEKFAIRGLLRNGLNYGDKVLVFTAKPIIDKVERALHILEEFVSKYYRGVTFKVVSVNVQDFNSAILQISRTLREEAEGEKIINLSGGMRSLIIETLAAVLIVGMEGEVEVELENFEGVIKFPLNIIKVKPPLSEEFKNILNTLIEEGGLSISELSRRLNVAKSTIHRRIKILKEMGLVETEYEGKRLMCSATSIAKLFISK